MPYKDSAMNSYMNNNEVFADAFNYFAFDGKKVIKPDKLQEMDPKEIIIPEELQVLEEEEGGKNKKKSIKLERDVLKNYAVKKHGDYVYFLLGVENQTYVNYAGPITLLAYDFFRCYRQVDKIKQEHKKAKDLKGDEYQSNFSKEDKIIGVISLVLFFSGKKWDGSRWLHEMYKGKISLKMRKMMLDYKVNLIEPRKMSEEDFAKFETALGYVLHFSKYSEDKEAMEVFYKSVLNKNIDTDAARVIDAIGNIGMTFKEGEKVTNVCESIEKMKRENEAKGIEKGIEKGMMANVKTVMKKMKMTAEQAMDFLDISDDSRAALIKML